MRERHLSAKALGLMLAASIAILLVMSCGDGDGAETSPTKSGPRTVGDTLEAEAGTLTIHSFEAPVTADESTIDPDNVFAVIDVEGCVDQQRGGVVTLYASAITLEMPDGTERQPTRWAKEPALADTPVQAGDCVRGFVTYEIPADERPAAVVYRTIPGPDVADQFSGEAVLRWAIP